MEEPVPPADTHATPQSHTGAGTHADMSGQVLGDYRILRRLGEGGMGQVYLAEQISLRRQVALKVLKPELADNETSSRRFKAEAEAVARATHANIVQIYNIGATGGVNYMALEYVEGRNLRDLVEKKKPISAEAGLKIMAQVAAALQRAGELSIIHRDIKPENILISRSGEVKVADFGLSRCFDRPQSLTRSGVVMGTPLYMSPEQVDATRPADHRSDLYAFGATAYFMFAGEPPFRGETPLEVAYQHVHKAPEPLAELRPDLPADLCALIHRMMAKQPEQRCQTAHEVAREVARLSEQLRVTSTLSSSVAPRVAKLVAEKQVASIPARKRLRLRHILAALSVLGALAAGLALGWYRQQPSITKAVTPPDDDILQVRALFSVEEREKLLRRLIKENYKPASPVDARVLAGLHAAVDLELLYLSARRLDDAEALARELCAGEEKGCPGRLLGQLSRAMAAAFRDNSAESNTQFLVIMGEFEKLDRLAALSPASKGDPASQKEWQAHQEDVEVYNLLWKSTPPAGALREMVARALHHNFENDPKNFPPKLEAYRHPPRPQAKADSGP
jgi:serine/threonine-protein kinase